MKKGRLGQYKGRLNAKEICEGINAANENSIRLLKDAELLFKEKRFASCVALAILSIEEAGKDPFLRALGLEKDDEHIIENWRAYRTHTMKNTAWLMPALISMGAKGLNDFKIIAMNDMDHQRILENLKQISLYTDCLENKYWSIPDKEITEEYCEGILAIAKLLARDKRMEEKEIELWIKYIKPVWRGAMEHMESAIISWSKEMHKLGLLKGPEDGMEKFIEGKFKIF
jgi:AbiV family abortive infection protein